MGLSKRVVCSPPIACSSKAEKFHRDLGQNLTVLILRLQMLEEDLVPLDTTLAQEAKFLRTLAVQISEETQALLKE